MKNWSVRWPRVAFALKMSVQYPVLHETVEDLPAHVQLCVSQVESVLLHIKTTNESKVAKQKGIDQRNLAIDWIRRKCGDCQGRGTCEGVVYFMDDDNTYDIRLFEQVRNGRGPLRGKC